MDAVTDRNKIEQLVKQELARIANADANAMDPETNLFEAYGIDSLYMLELYAMIELTFGVAVPLERLQTMDTVNRIVDTIIEFQE
jgi:acyl carrier protein